MSTIPVFDLYNKLVLVSRGSARTMQRRLTDALSGDEHELVLDFTGVQGMAPSFFDEVLSMIQETAERNGKRQLTVRVTNPPTRLTSKFVAVARAHDVQASESADGTWVIA